MTLTILIISFFIAFYIYKKSKNKENKNELNENFLLILLFIASLVWLVVSIIDFYNYGALVFTPSVDIFIKDILTGFMVLSVSMFLWFLSIITSNKKLDKIKLDKTKIKEVLSKDRNKNLYEDDLGEDKVNQSSDNKTNNTSHTSPSISVDYSIKQNDNNTRKGYFPYGNNPLR